MMVSKRFLLLVFAFATLLLFTSQIVAATGGVEDAKHEVEGYDHDHDDDGYDEDGPYDHDRHGGYDDDGYRGYDHDGPYDHHGHDGYYKGGHKDYDHDGPYDHDGHDGYYKGDRGDYDKGCRRYGGEHCRYGCCDRRIYYRRGCRCCLTPEEATAYQQAQQTHTRN